MLGPGQLGFLDAERYTAGLAAAILGNVALGGLLQWSMFVSIDLNSALATQLVGHAKVSSPPLPPTHTPLCLSVRVFLCLCLCLCVLCRPYARIPLHHAHATSSSSCTPDNSTDHRQFFLPRQGRDSNEQLRHRRPHERCRRLHFFYG